MFLFILLLLPASVFCSSFVQLSTLENLKKELIKVTSDDLIIFDVDNTLMIAHDLALRPCGEKFFLKQFQNFSNTMSEAQIKLLASKVLLKRTICPVEDQMPAFIQNMQQGALKVIALTSLFSGHFGAISSMEDWRVFELKSLEYDFSKAFPRYSHIVFGDIMRENSLPIYKDGVLFSSNHAKGEVIQAFLRRVKWQPVCIYYIDDDKTSIDSVNAYLTAEGINCHCLHYRAVEIRGDVLNEEIANKQFNYLRKHEEWLSDAQVKTLK